MVNKPWKIIPRPLLETVLNNHAQHHRVPQPLILHGPRGVGKTTLILERLLGEWNKGPHLTGYVDFAESIKDHHPQFNQSFPWASWYNCPPPTLLNCRTKLENCLESMAHKGVQLGSISSHQIFSTLSKWHGLNTALRCVISGNGASKNAVSEKVSGSVLWDRAVFALSARCNVQEIDGILGLTEKKKNVPLEEASYYREAVVALRLAKEVIKQQQSWRANAIAHLNRTGANERCFPVVLVTSDSYYSYQAYMDFGFPDIFISREAFGWSPQEAKLHMVTDYFSNSEWSMIAEVFGPNPRHLFELYALKQANYYQQLEDNKDSTFEDIVDSYLAYLQITVVNPAMDKALGLLQKFAADARSGKISKDRLRFGAPWRHPPPKNDPTMCLEWAKIQLMDFVQSLINTEFGINYLADCSLEIMDDPSAGALVEVGLLYAQRDPSIIRPISRGIQRCIVRWLVQERMQMSFPKFLQYKWQRIMRGRSYRHLMLQVGYK